MFRKLRFTNDMNKFQQLLLSNAPLEMVIDFGEQLERTYPRNEDITMWALIRNATATALATHPNRNKKHSQRACNMLSETRRHLDPNADRIVWADATGFLGYALAQLAHTEADFNEAIELLETARQITDQIGNENSWQAFTYYLGHVYRSNFYGDRSENVEYALKLYEIVQARLPRKSFLWGHVRHNIGLAYVVRVAGDHGANLDSAIEAQQDAMESIDKKTDIAGWLSAVASLGELYAFKVSGIPIENVEKAINLLFSTINSLPRDTSSTDLAVLQVKLASAYRRKFTVAGQLEYDQIVTLATSAIEALDKDEDFDDWLAAHHHLASAHLLRQKGDRSHSTEVAINILEDIIKYIDQSRFPAAWAETALALGDALIARTEGTYIDNLQRAINYYSKARAYFEVVYPQFFGVTITQAARLTGVA